MTRIYDANTATSYPLADEFLKESILLVREIETMTHFNTDRASHKLLVKLTQLRAMIGEYLKATR